MRSPLLAVTLALLLGAAPAIAGEFNTKLNVGDAAPAWTSLPGVDGKEHSLVDLKEAKLVLVVFTCNSCHVAVDYEDRIIAFAKKHADDVAVVAINVSTKPSDAMPQMQARAKEKGFKFPYLFDKTQEIGQAYGANFTPEFFLLNADRRVAYMGRLDDSTVAEKVKRGYLDEAVTAALAGATPKVAETAPQGCRIRYPRQRR